MSDAENNKESGGPVVTKISHCPHLGIYHYVRADGSEYLFDTPQLERSIDSYQKQGDARQAEFMAMLTGFARQFPHQVVSFDEEGRLNLQVLLAKSPGAGTEAGEVGGESATIDVLAKK
jgi:hypothetical protein